MKKYLMVIVPLFFLIGTFLIVRTYALFESNHVSTKELDMAKWQVKLNDSIVDGATSDFTISNVYWNESENTKSGKVAPGMTGYFDIEIDSNNTDVSIRYDVDFDFSNLDESQFKIDEIYEIDGNEIIKTSKSTYSGVIKLGDDGVDTLRVELSWLSDDLNNEKDSLLGKTFNNTLNIPVIVTISQYFDDDILEEYVPPEIEE